MTDLVKELGIDVVNTRVDRPSSYEGLEILQNIAKMTLKDIPHLNTKDRAKGEAKGLASFQYGENADFLINSEISGRMPYKLRCDDLAFLILTCVAFSLFGFIIGLWAENFEKLQIVPMLIITPLVFLGGSFYSISMLPPLWQKVTLFNPVLYLVSGFRWSFLFSVGDSYFYSR